MTLPQPTPTEIEKILDAPFLAKFRKGVILVAGVLASLIPVILAHTDAGTPTWVGTWLPWLLFLATGIGAVATPNAITDQQVDQIKTLVPVSVVTPPSV